MARSRRRSVPPGIPDPESALDSSSADRVHLAVPAEDGDAPEPDLGIVYRSPQMAGVLEMVRKAAAKSANVLILGESGTGKELIAHRIHVLSPRSHRSFVVTHLGETPETLIESLLFGHVKGAFSGATSDREGVFLKADGGTLFLDEIGELSLSAQIKLLRLLENKKIKPVGGDKERSSDVRFVFATNRDLWARVEDGAFREDLLYRIDVITIELPPLREREGDIPLLIEHFLREFSKELHQLPALSYEALRALCTYDWPGNVRQLRNVMERLVALHGDDGEIGLPEVERALKRGNEGELSRPPSEATTNGVSTPMSPKERADWALFRIQWEALEEAKGIISEAARKLGVTRKTFKDRMKRWERKGWVLRVDSGWILPG